jgi:hypothetical protein
VIRLIEQRENIVFVDEACFTSNQIRARYWAKAGDASLKIDKAKIGFKCIAVVGAINVQGRVVALLQRDLSIKTSDFVEFLRVLRTRMKRQKTYIFLDNLQVHHTHLVRGIAFEKQSSSYLQCFILKSSESNRTSLGSGKALVH